MSFKDKLIEFLKPDKIKLLFALIVPVFWEIFLRLVILIFKGPIPEGAAVIKVQLPLWYIVISYFISIILFYPSACSFVFIYKYRTTLIKEKILLIFTALGIIIFNPVVLAILLLSPFIILSMFKPPQGLYVVGVIPNSPASEGGNWIEGKTILKLNNTPVITITDALNVLENFHPDEWIPIKTKGTYDSIRLGKHPTLERAYIGIKVRDINGTEAVL